VHHRQRAPQRTIVEGKVRGGEIVELRVTPESRQGDIQIMSGPALRG
jgi:hypothetical protein